jgi:diguanylate cyclase (GGDEF)-like protein/PAS domain S-box-containing protein
MRTSRARAQRQAADALSPAHFFSAPPVDAQEVLGAGMYEWVAERSVVAMYLVAPDGRFVWANPAAGCLFGRSRHELLGCTLNDVSHPDDLAWSHQRLAAALERGAASYRIQKRYLRPDGDVVVADVSVTPLSDEGGVTLGFFASAIDDTERFRATQRADAADRLLRSSVDTLLDPWVLLHAIRDDDGAIVDFQYIEANREACRSNGIEHDALGGMRLLGLFPGHRGDLLDRYAHVVDTGIPLALDDHPFEVEGGTRWFDNRAVKVGDDDLSFTWRDVTEAHRLRSSLAHMANTDPLTGLNNRFGLEQALERLTGGERRTRGAGVSVLYLDLDGLTTINNVHGHPAGDRILRAVGERIAAAVRVTDIVARVGGDEFVVVALATDVTGAEQLAGKIRELVAQPVSIGVEWFTPSVSVGVCAGDATDDVEELMARADTALIRNKRARRG